MRTHFASLCCATLAIVVASSVHSQQSTDQDCDALKKAIEQLQENLAKATVALHDMEPILDRAIETRQKLEDEYKKLEKGGKFGAWGLSEEFRGQLLDTLIKSGAAIRKLKDAIQQTKNEIEALKAAINSLLNALANCGQKTESPTPTPAPSSTPSKRKKKHTDHQTSYVPPPTATPSTTDKVSDVLKTIGSHVSIGVGGGTSSGGDHHRHRGEDRHRTTEKTGGGKTSTRTTGKTTSSSSGKTVTAGCKCHPCTCSPCRCH